MSTITVNDMTQLALLGKNMKEVAKKYEEIFLTAKIRCVTNTSPTDSFKISILTEQSRLDDES